MFKERRTKFALLTLLSAVVVVSTAFVGVSIYAQTDDSELTTFEEEALAAGENPDSQENATSTAAADGETSTAADLSILEGLIICDVGTSEASGETEIASVPEDVTPTVSIKVMTETEVTELAGNETETASNETSIASADCIELGDGTSTSAADSGDNATSTDSTNETSTASAPDSNEEILVIEGQDFSPGQVVLMWSDQNLVGIDDVDDAGDIEAKIPMPESSGTQVAGNDTAGTELRLVESGTQRTATFEFDGETVTAGAGGDVELEEGAAGDLTDTPSGNATSTDSTDTSNSSSPSSSSSPY